MKIIKRFLSLMLVICVLTISCGCGKKPDSSTLSLTQAVPTHYEELVYGNYVYYMIGGTVFRCHMNTGEFSYACVTPACDHTEKTNCALLAVNGMAFVENNCLYYTYSGSGNRYYYASYNLLDGSTQVLRACSSYEAYPILPRTDGTYMYYTCRVLKEGGDTSNPDDYVPAVFRQSLVGGAEEYLCEINDTWQLYFATNEYLIFCANRNVLISTNLNGEDPRILFEQEDCVLTNSEQMYNGKIYFLANDGTFELTVNGSKSYHYKLLSVDIATGQTMQVINEYVSKFIIADDCIYYLPYKMRVLYMPKDFGKEGTAEKCITYSEASSLHVCNLDGSDDEIVYTNEALHYNNFGIYDGVLYGEAQFYDYNTNKKSMPTFIELDLKNGTLTEIADMSDYLTIYLPN